jgi:hypothetical protein
MRSVPTWTVVVPLEATSDVVGDSNVVPCGVAVTSKDVDDSLLDSVHTTRNARAVPSKLRLNRTKRLKSTQILQSNAASAVEEGGPPSRLRRFGETAFACGDSPA